eukprot:122538-Amphidinium_carterae.2
MHIYSDCQRTVNILREGPEGHRWRNVAHAHLWHELWKVHREAIPCTKVPTHTSWKSAKGDPTREQLWLGNSLADRYAK